MLHDDLGFINALQQVSPDAVPTVAVVSEETEWATELTPRCSACSRRAPASADRPGSWGELPTAGRKTLDENGAGAKGALEAAETRVSGGDRAG